MHDKKYRQVLEICWYSLLSYLYLSAILEVWCPSSLSLQGAKEDTAQCKEPVNKAGWLKKDTGRLLSSYKDRYIRVEKTEVLVYENEVH